MFPELTDCEIEQGESRIVIDIKKRAGNRKIMGVSGLIQPPKAYSPCWKLLITQKINIFLYLSDLMIRLAGLKSWKKSKESLKKRISKTAFFNKVEKDGEFNQILESFDLIWGAYENFPWSSNHLGKAAILKKTYHCERLWFNELPG